MRNSRRFDKSGFQLDTKQITSTRHLDEFDNSDDGVELKIDFVGLLKRHYPLILLGCFVGCLGAAIYYSKQVPSYQSSLAVHVGQKHAELSRAEKGDTGGISMQDQVLETHLELITSPKVLTQANDRLSKDASSSGLRVNTGRLVVSRSNKGASTIRASYSDTNPENAVKILLAVYETYKEYIDSKSKNVSSEAAELIAKSLVENENAVRAADEEYRDEIANIPALVDSDGRIQDVHRLRLATLESELSTVRGSASSALARKQLITSFLESKRGEEITEVEVISLFDEKDMARFNKIFMLGPKLESSAESYDQQLEQMRLQRFLELNVKRKGLEARFGGGHPEVESIIREMAVVDDYFTKARRAAKAERTAKVEDGKTEEPAIPRASMLRSYTEILDRDMSELAKRASELLSLSESEEKLARGIYEKSLNTAALKSKLDRAQARYDEAFKRLQEIDLAQDYVGFTMDLIAPPVPAGAPTWPQKSKIAGVGVMAGLMLGLGLAFLAEYSDKTFRNPEDVERTLRSSIMAHIPNLDIKEIAKSKLPNSHISPVVVTFHKPRGTESETYRVLRTSMLFASKRSEQSVLMVTSPCPGDGKSTTISNLAVSLAQTGKKVLLVDADLRRPTICTVFGMETSFGLSDFISDQRELQKCVRPSEQPDLDICSNGSKTSRPAELLESDRFREFVTEARHLYDFVLIDTPPVLAVADPMIVGEAVDACLLAIKVDRSSRSYVERARRVLAEHDVDILGIVVNAAASNPRGYGYKSYNYNSRYEYGKVASYRKYYSADDDDAPKNGSMKPESFPPRSMA